MEYTATAAALKVAYNLVIFGIKLDQVPAAVRRCLELVRTCHLDLEDLIKLRNESLPMLESKPAILERVNTIIQNAHRGLLDVARLVEKLRPEVHDGRSPFKSRLEWLFIDSGEFTSQEPLIARQHSSVIAELNFLRQLVLLTPLIDGARTGHNADADVNTAKRAVVAWDNVALLDEMLGGNKRSSVPANGGSIGLQAPPNAYSWQARPVSPAVSMVTDPPPPYTSPQPGFAVPGMPRPSTETRNPLVYNASISHPQWHGTSGRDHGGLESTTKTTFDTGGIPFLFSDLKKTPGRQEVTPVTMEQPAENTIPWSQQFSSKDTTSQSVPPFSPAGPLSTASTSRPRVSLGWQTPDITEQLPPSQPQYLYAVPDLGRPQGSFEGLLQTTAMPTVASAEFRLAQDHSCETLNLPGQQACLSSTTAGAGGGMLLPPPRSINGQFAAELPSASAGEQVLWQAGPDGSGRHGPHYGDAIAMRHGTPPCYGANAERGRTEISELSAVLFPPDPVELE